MVTRTVEKTLGYLAAIEQMATSVLNEPPFDHRIGEFEFETRGSRPEDKAHDTLLHLRNFAWAVRTFPIFDTRCLSRMKEIQLKVDGIPPDKAPKLFVPFFAWGSLNTSGIDIDPSCANHISIGKHEVYFDYDLIRENELTLRSILNQRMTLRARPPVMPQVVEESVRKVADRFSSVYQIWEAEWQPRPLGDPLIVGEVLGEFFLIEQYDLTKTERYIVSEFSAPPRK